MQEMKVTDISGGSNDVTQLIEYSDGSRKYRKTAIGQQGIEKLQQQINWLQNNQKIIPTAVITAIDVSKLPKQLSYYMEYSLNAEKLSTFFIKSKKTNTYFLISKIFNQLNNRFYIDTYGRVLESDIKNYYQTKVKKNIDFIESQLEIFQFNQLKVNGHWLNSLSSYQDIFSLENLIEVFKDDRITNVHGDLTAENIIISDDNYYFIDSNSNNIINSKEMDYGKFLQSIFGEYELLMSCENYSIKDNQIDFKINSSFKEDYSDIWKFFKKEFLDRLEKSQVISCYYHLAVHWLRLLPYKIKKNFKPELFYAELLVILNFIRNNF